MSHVCVWMNSCVSEQHLGVKRKMNTTDLEAGNMFQNLYPTPHTHDALGTKYLHLSAFLNR